MVTLRNKKPGDIFYPDYSRVKTLSCPTGVTKGSLYTLNTDGDVTLSPSSGAAVKGLLAVTGGIVNFTRGVVQAMETVPAATGAKGQFLCAGSRVGLKMSATASHAVAAHGSAVKWNQSNDTAEVFNVPSDEDVGATVMDIAGRIFEIYGSSDGIAGDDFAESATRIGTEKAVAGANDIVIVELGMK